MRKKVQISLILLAIFSIFHWVFAQDTTSERQNYKSCIDLNSRLTKFLKNTDLQTSKSLTIDFLDPKNQVSTTFSSLYQNHQLLILKNPSETTSLSNAKVISRIHIPRDWQDFQHLILENDLLIFSAKTKNGYEALLYKIENDKIKIVKSLTFSSPLIAIRSTAEKILFITEKQLTTSDLKSLLKDQKTEKLTKLTLSPEYQLGTWETLTPTCKQIQHLLNENTLPQLITITLFDLHAPEKTPEINYYLWSPELLHTEPDYLFMGTNLKNQTIDCKNCISNASGNNTALIQRFALQPRLYQTESAILSWEIINFLSESKNKPNLLKMQTSWKVKQYSLVSFDQSFRSIQKEQILGLSKEDRYSLHLSPNNAFFSDKTKTQILPILPNYAGSNIKKDQKTDFRYAWPSENKILKTRIKSNEIQVSLYEITTSWEVLIWENVIPQEANSQLFWSEKNHALSFFTNAEKPLLHTYIIDSKGQAILRTTRDYSKLSTVPTFQNLQTIHWETQSRTLVQFKEYLDIFSHENPSNRKLIKL